MRAIDVIRKKRDGGELSPQEIEFFVSGYTADRIPDYQVAAWLMAVLLRGMTRAEIAALTESMLHSGSVLDLSDLPGPRWTSTPPAAWATRLRWSLRPWWRPPACGAHDQRPRPRPHRRHARQAGIHPRLQRQSLARGIPARARDLRLRADRPDRRDRARRQEALRSARRHRHRRKPAPDLRLHHEQEAGGGHRRPGAGREDGQRRVHEVRGGCHLAGRTMVGTGERMGKKMVALITDMDQPLGNKVGNALEVEECIEVMRGAGPADLRELCLELAGWMLFLAGRVTSLDEGQRLAAELIASGAALERFREIIALQGGDAGVIDDTRRLPQAAAPAADPEPSGGFVASIQCEQVGVASLVLGGGRERKKTPSIPRSAWWCIRKSATRCMRASRSAPSTTIPTPGSTKLAGCWRRVTRLRRSCRSCGGRSSTESSRGLTC